MFGHGQIDVVRRDQVVVVVDSETVWLFAKVGVDLQDDHFGAPGLAA